MKSKFFVVSLFTFFGLSASAAIANSHPSMNEFGSMMHCQVIPRGSNGDRNSGAVIDRLSAHCENGKKIRISGVGLGARYSFLAEVTLACSESEPDGVYPGLKAAVALVAGMQVGLFGNSHGVCFLSSTELGVGIALDGGQLEIKDQAL